MTVYLCRYNLVLCREVSFAIIKVYSAKSFVVPDRSYTVAGGQKLMEFGRQSKNMVVLSGIVERTQVIYDGAYITVYSGELFV